MRAVVQRVKEASVYIAENLVSKIGKGIVVFLGLGVGDDEQDIKYLADKIINLRIFEDEEGKLNLSTLDVKGDILIVSQFTLYGNCRKGRRPSFDLAAPPKVAEELYNRFVNRVKESGVEVKTGVFQARMLVDIHNDGPVTLILESKG